MSMNSRSTRSAAPTTPTPAHSAARPQRLAASGTRPTADPIESATTVLTRAIDAIDAEVGAAQERADEATTEYEHLRDSAEERKASIQAKIDALKPSSRRDGTVARIAHKQSGPPAHPSRLEIKQQIR